MKTNLFLAFLLVLIFNAFSQNQFPVEALKKISLDAYYSNYEKIDCNDNFSSSNNKSNCFLKSRVFQKNHLLPSKSGDTLFIGLVPGDSLFITGIYSYDGTIAVYGDGKLVFDNADATITGDLLIYGLDAHVWILNSNLHFPQTFYYQRAIIAGLNSIVDISNSTLDYFGLPHDLVITDNANINWNNVTNLGYTTCGLSLNSQININGTNQAGEFIFTGNAVGNFQNAESLLIWHHIPDTATINITFPSGEDILSFNFVDYLSGLININYTYQITNCDNVQWGLMPEPGSNVEITDSKIRTIGVWFSDLPDYQVSGLVNNSTYSDFVAPLSSHNIHLINTEVQTWSLYMFDNAYGEVSNCIVGEIGTMGNSSCNISNTLIDGSGGYLFATDFSTTVAAYSYINSNFQTSGNAFGIFAYGSQNIGRTIGFEKSILIIIQSNLVSFPEIYDDALIYYLKLNVNPTYYSNSLVEINGAAFIQHASDYYSHDVGWYIIEYSLGTSEIWHPACDTVFNNEVFDGQLCVWNTTGLEYGTYSLRITMADNTTEQNKIEAIKQVNLIPLGTEICTLQNFDPIVFPNPIARDQDICLLINSSDVSYFQLVNQLGTVSKFQAAVSGINLLKTSSLNLCPGFYYIELFNSRKELLETKKIVLY